MGDLRRLNASAVAVAVALSGCAATPQQFAAKRGSMSSIEVCRAVVSARAGNDLTFMSETFDEASRRGLTVAQCEESVAKERRDLAVGVAAVALVALAVAAGSKGGGSSGGNNYASTSDYQWEWDQFYNAQYQLVWACRGVQTGQFADLSKCQYKAKSDWKWPGKTAP